MFSKSSWLHLRFPFSFFLLPIFLFALAISPNFNGPRMFWVFFIVHFLLYPASNGYNSYFDKDEQSIGGLRNPPPTSKGLYYLALAFDALAIVLGYVFINLLFAVMLLIYGLISKGYSHPMTRFKRHGITSLLLTGIFQGLFTFLMCYAGLNNYGLDQILGPQTLIPGVLATLMLMANYPLTQVYQHDEDSRRGDITLSIMLGIRGTFYFSAITFIITAAAFLYYFQVFHDGAYSMYFILAIAPVISFFILWFLRVKNGFHHANYSNTMRLNFISAISLNIFFLYFFLDKTQLLQLFI